MTKRTPTINFHLGDCMDFMRELPDNAYDLAIVDPPYGSSIMAKNKYQRHSTAATTYRNKDIPSATYFKELARVSKASIIWGAQYMMKHLDPKGSFIIWDKGANPDIHHMSAVDVAWFTRRVQIKKCFFFWCGAVKCENEQTIHIHQKPVRLYKWLLTNYAKPGQRILDTHGGSMSSAIACFDLGYDLDIVELDPDYFAAGKARFERHVNRWHQGMGTPITDPNDYTDYSDLGGIFSPAPNDCQL